MHRRVGDVYEEDIGGGHRRPHLQQEGRWTCQRVLQRLVLVLGPTKHCSGSRCWDAGGQQGGSQRDCSHRSSGLGGLPLQQAGRSMLDGATRGATGSFHQQMPAVTLCRVAASQLPSWLEAPDPAPDTRLPRHPQPQERSWSRSAWTVPGAPPSQKWEGHQTGKAADVHSLCHRGAPQNLAFCMHPSSL